RWRPRAVLTFPPNGSNGHPDHVVTNELVTAALAGLETPPEAVYYFAGDAPSGLDPRPGFLPPDRIADLHLPVTHFFEVGDALENKLRAMAQHETQARSVLMFMRRFPNRVLVETFHRVSPEVPPGTPPQAVT